MKLKDNFTLIGSSLVVALVTLIAIFGFLYYKQSIKETIAQQQFRMISIFADEIDNKLLTTQQHIVSVAKAAPLDINGLF